MEKREKKQGRRGGERERQEKEGREKELALLKGVT